MAIRCRIIGCVRNADSMKNPPPPPPSGIHSSTVSIAFIGYVIAATLLLGVFYMVIARFFSRRSNLRQRSIGNPTTTSPRNDPPILFDTREEFFDEEQGPHLDHPIWYIRTVGLDQSAIDSIAAFKFKKGEGPIAGTDCSVCLTEFEDDEALRLLPNCSHAFHVACIDMWLRSHKNCPLCRAAVVKSAPADADEADNVAANSSPAENATSDDGARVSEIEEGESSGGAIVVQNEEAVVKGLRRSVSMDAASASEIYRAVGVAINGGGRERVKKGKNLSFSSTSRSRIIGTSFRLYRNIKSCSFGHERRNTLLP